MDVPVVVLVLVPKPPKVGWLVFWLPKPPLPNPLKAMMCDAGKGCREMGEMEKSTRKKKCARPSSLYACENAVLLGRFLKNYRRGNENGGYANRAVQNSSAGWRN